ncbi:MAG: hypothetical protein RR033_01860 [Clostridia bacterium]
MTKKIISLVLLITVIIGLFCGCNKKTSEFTEDEHIARVTERIQERFITEETEYTSFEVYPLYNENDELKYLLVEFEPCCFIFILLRDERAKVLSWFGAPTSMYTVSNLFGKTKDWSPYLIDETNSQPIPDRDIIWKVDDDGNKVSFNKSPFYISNNLNERKYLLRSGNGNGYVCAIKNDDIFINLISTNEENFTISDLSKRQPTIHISFIPKKRFDL